jgi:N-acetyl-gamma-glutamyl-phosphate reductase
MANVFIDGQAGTTGLLIKERLAARPDITLLEIDPERRKDGDAKQDIIDAADVVILCLPDEAAIKTVAACNNSHTRFIDASTAHRTHPNWTYGFPEMTNEQRSNIARARYISNPGCYPTGFLAGVKPLIDEAILNSDALISINALSGYSGGGRQMIESYEAREAMSPHALWYSRPYSLNLQHKHVPEMTRYSGLSTSPIFQPSVGHFYQGMLVSVPIAQAQFTKRMGLADIYTLLAARYESETCIKVHAPNDESPLTDGFLDPQGANGTNRLDLMLFGHEEQMVLIARLDNLGKGASGAAVQNMNLVLGLDEMEGLRS